MSIDLNTEGRLIIAMGMGTDTTGKDVGAAVQNAVSQALQHSSLTILKNLDVAPQDVRVKVTLGVPDVAKVTPDHVVIPFAASAEIVVVDGGMEVVDPENGARQFVASAAIEVFLPKQKGWRLRTND